MEWGLMEGGWAGGEAAGGGLLHSQSRISFAQAEARQARPSLVIGPFAADNGPVLSGLVRLWYGVRLFLTNHGGLGTMTRCRRSHGFGRVGDEQQIISTNTILISQVLVTVSPDVSSSYFYRLHGTCLQMRSGPRLCPSASIMTVPRPPAGSSVT